MIHYLLLNYLLLTFMGYLWMRYDRNLETVVDYDGTRTKEENNIMHKKQNPLICFMFFLVLYLSWYNVIGQLSLWVKLLVLLNTHAFYWITFDLWCNSKLWLKQKWWYQGTTSDTDLWPTWVILTVKSVEFFGSLTILILTWIAETS